ncbi:NKG2-A/NKG2-B type II integral membrane protein-like [Tenrec ecaudatus]|uniref:NKG2-A/NKG2-B type II integral membrane protein-like n=1 Tax=Tenrec ecaudatus TaxID=94439 RepID=UPI003F5AAA44
MNNQAILYSDLNLTKSSKKQRTKPKDANAPISTTVQEISYAELNLQNTCQNPQRNKKNFHCREKLTAGVLAIICIVLVAGVIALTTNTPSIGMLEKNNTLKTSHCDGCMEDWFSYSNHCYHISTEKKNWTESRMACASQKSNLLIIENDEEMAFMRSLSPSSWIGLTRKSASHDWFWINDSVFKNKNPLRGCTIPGGTAIPG